MTQNKVVSSLLFMLLIMGSMVFVAATGCNGGGGGANPARVDVMATSLDTFDPRDIVVDKGTLVVWTNVDTDNHTVIVDPLDPVGGGPNSDLTMPAGIVPQGTFSWRVPDNAVSGTIWYYHCRIHGTAGTGHNYGNGMVGVMIVR
jgi:plastocyanin